MEETYNPRLEQVEAGRLDWPNTQPTVHWAIVALTLGSALRLVTALYLGWELSSRLSSLGILTGLLGLLLTRLGRPKLGLSVSLSSVILLCSYSGFAQDGLSNIGMPILPVILVFAGLLLDRILLYGLTALCVVLVGLMLYLRAYLGMDVIDANTIGDAVIYLSTILLAVQVSQIFSKNVLRSFERVLRSQKIIEEGAEALRKSEQRWQLALAGTNDGMWDWDMRSGEVFLSDRWKRMLGYEPEELESTEHTWRQLMHPEDLAAVQKRLEEHMAGQSESYAAEFRIRAKSGEYLWILARGRALFDENGKAIRITGSHTDMTTRKQAESALRLAQHRAEAANRAKSNFFANVSHELRTPLNAVIGLTDLLRLSTLSAEQEEQVKTMRSSSQLLLSIINNVLDFSKMEAGQLVLENRTFSLRGAIEESVQLQVPQARQLGLALRWHVNPRLADRVKGDKTYLQQILLNLLSNAVKFTPVGEVSLEVEPEGEGDGSVICISVRDTGLGISQEAQSRLFTDFYQGDATSTRKFGGCGLGLAICRRLVTLMGASIEVESEIGKGSVFRLRVPLPEAQEEAELTAPGVPDEAVSTSRPLRVLLAEDNKVNQKVAAALLKRLNCEVAIANDGREAVEVFTRGPVDLIFMDCHMPELDGFEATRQIRSLEAAGASVPIVALTADVFESGKERCLSAGMNDYLSKPIELIRLREVIQRWSHRLEKS
jgi:PAS domain S-box-containing protein